jgi:signal transduction histidine kinase/CheY-like chemotaxis protein
VRDEKRLFVIHDLPSTTTPISSGLFQARPRNVIVLPVLFEDEVKAVIELASLGGFTESHLAFLEQLTASIGIVLNSIEATMQTEGLLQQSQQLATELQTAAEGAAADQRAAGAEGAAARRAERRGRAQEPGDRAGPPRARGKGDRARADLEVQVRVPRQHVARAAHAAQLDPHPGPAALRQRRGQPAAQADRVRAHHPRRGLGPAQPDHDILDLSKIESGTVAVVAENVQLANVLESIARPFRIEAENKRLELEVVVDPGLPDSIVTDQKRLQQVLKNLLSNAFKFTDQGRVRLAVAPAKDGWSKGHPLLDRADGVVAFEVSDTGIGIAPEKQRIIFEAFQQADAGTSRKYGGTGLGLAISRELASLLGGEIQLRSMPGVGSTFTMYLPLAYAGPIGQAGDGERTRGTAAPVFQPARAWDQALETVPDDRESIAAGDSVLLIVEDDPHYARILVEQARLQGFKVLVAARGADALALAREHRPTAVSLDVFLPDMLGWTVLSQLKQDPAMRHIPVQIVTLDEDRQHGLARGAFSFLPKPTTAEGLDEALARIKDYAKPRSRRLLVIEDNEAEQVGITALLGHDDVEIRTGRHGQGGARGAARQRIRLRGARPPAAGHVGLRGARAHARRPRAARRAGRRLHGQGAVARGGRAAAHARAQRRGQGRRVARAAARRDRAVPAPRAGRPSGREAGDARPPAPLGRRPRRQEGAGRRRRRAQHLRALERARAARHGRC